MHENAGFKSGRW
ncbi:uncharacterized protein NPIL_330011, partial [Nephila pilipes]